MAIYTTFKNGSKEITATITSSNNWEAEGRARIYFDIEFDKKRTPINKFYEVVEGGTRDKVVVVGGRTFGYKTIGCDSNTKRRSAEEAVQDLAEQIVGGEAI